MEGNYRVEKYMGPVREAIDRHIKRPSRERTDIYNRAYEAVWTAVRENEPIVRELVEVCEALMGALTPKQQERQWPNIYKMAQRAIAKTKENYP